MAESRERAAADDDELNHVLAVLRAVEGVFAVGAYPKDKFDSNKLNNNGVKCRVFDAAGEELTSADPKTNVHCGAQFSDKLAAAVELKRRVTVHLGTAALEAAEQRVKECSGSSSSSAALPVFEYQTERSRLRGAVEAARLRVEAARQAARKADKLLDEQQRALSEARAALEALETQHPYKRVRREAEAAAAAAEQAEEAGARARASRT